MTTIKRSPLVTPAWTLILLGSAAFIYCAYSGLLSTQ